MSSLTDRLIANMLVKSACTDVHFIINEVFCTTIQSLTKYLLTGYCHYCFSGHWSKRGGETSPCFQ